MTDKGPRQELNTKLASTRENLTLCRAYNKGADQPVRLHSLIIAFPFANCTLLYSDLLCAKCQ